MSLQPVQVQEAFEFIAGQGEGAVVLSCEHASRRLPGGWAWPPEDLRLVESHWAWDPGAADLTRELAAALMAPAVLSRFTRLLVDPNREENAQDLFRSDADGGPVWLNREVDGKDRTRRIRDYYRAYHCALDRRMADHRPALLLSIHSFTPVYQGVRRRVQLGVLYNHDEALALQLHAHLSADLPEVQLNQPYSGREGLIHAAESHALAHGCQALELEVRQDLAVDPGYREQLVRRVVAFMNARFPGP